MAIAAVRNPLVERLLLALGLEPNETRKVVIEIVPDDLVRVYAVFLPNADDIRRVCEVFGTRVIPVADVVVREGAVVEHI